MRQKGLVVGSDEQEGVKGHARASRGGGAAAGADGEGECGFRTRL